LAAEAVQIGRDLRYLLGRRDRRVPRAGIPLVSIVIPAYNEERVIEEKLKNTLALDYPAEKLEVILVSDGSTDRTSEIAAGFAPAVKVLIQPQRSGKPAALNRGIAEATGEVVIITDANTTLDHGAVRNLARHFGHERIGAVLGDLHCTAPGSYQSENRYWDYERALKFLEGRIGALLGGQGGIYAIRRACYRPIPAETWVDDFVIGMRIKEAGYRLVYDTEAVAFEETTPSVEAEFVRKARIAAGDFQALAATWRLLNPLRGSIAFSYWSHKVLRWLAPFFLIAAFIANLFLLNHRFYQITFGLQAVLYAAGFLGHYVGKKSGLLGAFALPYYFVFMNAALLVGLFRCIAGRQRAAWQRTER
jgi:cellulose synthase/poly-beta-1,6-N-acetylglucosamine synthase-like glycosyltransferase